MNNSIAGGAVDTLTGVARPVEHLPVNSSQEIALTSGWLLLGIGIVLIIFIFLFKRKLGKKPRLERVIDSISPRIIRAYYKSTENMEKALKRKGLSDSKIDKCFNYLRKGSIY
jgi:hypothetical protein